MAALFSTLVACGGGSESGDSTEEKAAALATRIGTSDLNTCPAGGATIEAGFDTNGNGQLDAAEVSSTQHVCNGSDGAPGASAAATLLTTTAESPGANCPAGGFAVRAGPDTNGNSILDSAEVMNTEYACNGSNGTNGAPGSNGRDGLNTLIAIVNESAGANCANGGSKVTSGQDADRDGLLDTFEVSATAYTCNGAPEMTWVTVSDTAVQAEESRGYVASNDTDEVVLTLPSAPAVGGIIEVSGAGEGGWRIAQNAGQSILIKDLPSDSPPGARWAVRTVGRSYTGLASSANGRKLAACVGNGNLMTSGDSGVTWTDQPAVYNCWGVASSADGTRLVAGGVNGDYLYVSADSGATWAQRGARGSYQGIASSADGTHLAAVSFSDLIQISADSGVTWTGREAARHWLGIASSAEGRQIVAVAINDWIYVSTDYGQTWTPRDAVRAWRAVASSADGTRLVAVGTGIPIYTSADSGVTWTARGTAQDRSAVASSADGSVLVTGYGSSLEVSTDAGVSWFRPSGLSLPVAEIAASSDGLKLVVAAGSARLFTSDNTRTTPGTAGGLSGGQYDSIELQYLGGGVYGVVNYYSFSGEFAVQ